MIEEALSDEGYETIVAENGLEGIERAQAYLPDLVISDVVMEKADGYQVLATLRNEPTIISRNHSTRPNSWILFRPNSRRKSALYATREKRRRF